MKLSANAEAIYKDMETKYSRCITRAYEKKYFQSGLDGYTITAYKEVIKNAFNSECITKDEAVHLLEILKLFSMSIHKLLEKSEVMKDA